MKQRYVIVHYDQALDGYSLVQPNWGRYHYDDKAEALKNAEGQPVELPPVRGGLPGL